MITTVITKKHTPSKLRDKLIQSESRAIKQGGSANALTGSDNSPTIVDLYNQKSDIKPVFKDGWIWKVVPQINKVWVIVSTTPHDTSLQPESDLSSGPLMFNHFIRDKEESPEAYRLLPLVNFNVQEGLSLESLVKAKVKVRIHPTTNIADQAELVFGDSGSTILPSGITQADVVRASQFPGELRDNLIKLGFNKKDVEEYINLKVESEGKKSVPEEQKKDDPGVFRLKGEGYYDQVLEDKKDKQEKWKPPESWVKASQTMKNKLCHSPIIAFSAK